MDHAIFRSLSRWMTSLGSPPFSTEAERRRHVGPRLLERSQRFRGIADEHGRLMVVMSHSSDIADGGEREVEDYEFFRLFSMDSYAMAIDVLLYAMLP